MPPKGSNRSVQPVERWEGDVTRCPSTFELELQLQGRAAPDVAAHVGSCSRCSDRLAEMRRQGEEFERSVYPATIGAILSAVDQDVAERAASAGEPQARRLTVHAAVDGEERALEEGAPVAADATLRVVFRVRARQRAWIVAVGDGARVWCLRRAVQGGGAIPIVTQPMGVTVPLDGRPGPERIYAISAWSGLTSEAVEAACAAIAAAGPDAVRTTRALSTPGRRVVQESVLLEKGS